MNDLDAEKLRPAFEELAKSISSLHPDAFFEIRQDARGVPCIHANAAGFICAGSHLIRQGLNATCIPDDKPLILKIRDLAIPKDKSGYLDYE